MKINSLLTHKVCHKKIKKAFRVMKITFLLILIFASNLFAVNSEAQNAVVELRSNDLSIEDLFKEIEQQTDYLIVYSTSEINSNFNVTLSKKKAKVAEILDEVLGTRNLKYELSDNYIVLSKITQIEDTQQVKKSILGSIKDEEGNPIIGANVVEKGTTNGTITNIDGQFSLNVFDNAILVVSYVGYKEQQVKIGNRSNLEIVLQEDAEKLDEVVVVGYGTQKKSDLTGSIASIKASEIKNLPVNSVEEALQGKVAGVMVNKSNGSAGAGSDIVIRGIGSINGLGPLFVIDGVARGGGVDYNMKDIESIEIIKDASAAAIYGAKAAGGVVLITTKKGAFNSKPQFDFSANVGFKSLSGEYNMLHTSDYIRARRAYGQDYAIWDDHSSLPDTDWMKELFSTGMEQRYNLSLTGGSEKIKYYLSTSYNREDGIQENNYWERIAARLNVDYKISKAFTIGTRVYLARFRNSSFTTALPWRTLPYMSVYNEDGTFSSVPTGIEFSGTNPVAALFLNKNRRASAKVDADLYIDWNILEGLKFNVTGAASTGSGFDDNLKKDDYTPRNIQKGNYTKGLNYDENYTLTMTLDYAKTFAEKHEFKALIGYEAKYYLGANVGAQATDFPVEDPESFALSVNNNKSAWGGIGRDRYLSLFGRVNYVFDNRYLLTVNLRRDGSPKFGPNNRWGTFPSASVGWKLHEESFFKNANIDWVASLKPRFSWGILGNDAALGAFMYSPSYSSLTLHSFDGVNVSSGYSNIKVINEDIKWESIYTTDVGLDFGLFNNRLTGSFDYYIRKTKDMIYSLPTPLSAGITQKNDGPQGMPVNIGRIDNKGWELLLAWRDNIGDFRYGLSVNLSQNKNKVVDLGLSTAYIYDGGEYPFDASGSDRPFKTINNSPIGMLWGLKTDGLITSQAEIDALNAKARENGHEYYSSALTGVGDLKFVDLNGDGTITNDDRTFIGSPWPDITYGFNIDLGYKGFDLSANFVGVAGREIMNYSKSFQESFVDDWTTTYDIFNSSFFLGNGLTDQPRVVAVDPTTGAIIKDPNRNYSYYSDYIVEDGSYLKLKSLTLGYTLPKKVSKKLFLNHLRFYVTGYNLLTFTKFSGLDPEFSGNKTAYSGYSIYQFPQSKMISFGVDVNF